MGFLLDKYYFDAVTPDGACHIGYAARMKWAGLCFSYHGGIWMDPAGEVRTRDRYLHCPQPRRSGAKVEWSTILGEGSWEGVTRTGCIDLLEGSTDVCWEPIQEMAVARIAGGPFGPLTGLGYTERSRLTIPPWRLPIRVLHWGRFHGERNSLVWIRWEGPRPLAICLMNGQGKDHPHIDRDGIAVEGASLRFLERRVIRDATLHESLFGRARWPFMVFPGSALAIHEQKFLSRAVLASANGVTEEGWALHEIVRWP